MNGSILDGLISKPPVVTGRRAFLFPVLAGFQPGQALYEETVERMRAAPHVDIFGLTPHFGPVSEEVLATYGPLIDLCGTVPRLDLEKTGAIRTRAWLDSVGDTYERLVLLSHLPAKTLRHWSRAIPFHPISDRVRIISLGMGQKPTDPYFTKLFSAALKLP